MLIYSFNQYIDFQALETTMILLPFIEDTDFFSQRAQLPHKLYIRNQ